MVVVAALMTLAACSTAPDSPPTAPPASTPPPPPAAPAPEPSADACHAKAYQHLVGRPRSEVPIPVKPELQRVACATCPITMDYNPERLNFFFDAATGIIKEVRCG
jgi:hypothetical protein